MRTETNHGDSSLNNILLPATILLANIDMTGLFEYALKALTGGAIWLAFKLAGEYIQRRRKRKTASTRYRHVHHKKTNKENGNTE